MKTKLLKHLRKQAKRKYVIKQDHDGYHVCTHIDFGFFADPYITAVSCKKIEHAYNACIEARRKYILNEVRSMRNKHYDILDL